MTAKKTAVGPTPNEAAAEADLEVILPSVDSLEVEGIPARVERLRFRELMQILRIITRGMRDSNLLRSIDMSGGTATAGPQLIGALIFAIPEAPDEFSAFLRMVVKAKDGRQQKALDETFDNPSFDTITDIVGIVWAQEEDEINHIVGKLGALFNGTNKAGINSSK